MKDKGSCGVWRAWTDGWMEEKKRFNSGAITGWKGYGGADVTLECKDGVNTWSSQCLTIIAVTFSGYWLQLPLWLLSTASHVLVKHWLTDNILKFLYFVSLFGFPFLLQPDLLLCSILSIFLPAPPTYLYSSYLLPSSWQQDLYLNQITGRSWECLE